MSELETRIKEVSKVIRRITSEEGITQEVLPNNLCNAYTTCTGCPLMRLTTYWNQEFCVTKQERFTRRASNVITPDSLASLTSHLIELQECNNEL